MLADERAHKQRPKKSTAEQSEAIHYSLPSQHSNHFKGNPQPLVWAYWGAQTVCEEDAFAALLADGSVSTWGSPRLGGDSEDVQDARGHPFDAKVLPPDLRVGCRCLGYKFEFRTWNFRFGDSRFWEVQFPDWTSRRTGRQF